MIMTAPIINGKRLLDDLKKLRTFGQCKTGVVRPAFSQTDMDARLWLKAKMLEADLDARIDGLGNVIGYSGKSDKTLLMGSHTDTQPEGGWLDGAYGVICALEISRALAECPDTKHLSLDIASWADEEHTYHGFLGCKGFLDILEPDAIASSHNAQGQSLIDALKNAGLNGESEKYDPSRYIGYLETHIEQGPRLDMAGHQAGVVTGIVGCRDFDISFTGEMNHAGSTPMNMRRDAGMALIEFGHRLNQRFQQLADKYTVWTFGRAEFSPGAACVVPGEAVLHLQYRDISNDLLDKLEDATRQLADNLASELKAEIRVNRESCTQPVIMDDDMQAILAEVAEQQLPGKWQSLPSAAMHDANMFAQAMPTGMLFVPSIGGISHNFLEETKEEDLVAGCQLAATAVAEILKRA